MSQLVLAGSLGTTSEVWRGQLPSLTARFQVVPVEHRGHGGAPARPGRYSIDDLGRDVIRSMDELGVQRAGFAGVSLGGMVGLWLAAHAPERVERLAVLCTSAYLPPAEYWAQRASAVRAAGSLEPIADAVVARWLTAGFAEAHPETLRWLREMLVSVDAEGYAGCCEAIEHMDLRVDLRSIACPTLVIAGTYDAATPREGHASVIAQEIAGARLEEVPAAHLANVEQPGMVSQLLVEHFSQEDADGR